MMVRGTQKPNHQQRIENKLPATRKSVQLENLCLVARVLKISTLSDHKKVTQI